MARSNMLDRFGAPSHDDENLRRTATLRYRWVAIQTVPGEQAQADVSSGATCPSGSRRRRLAVALLGPGSQKRTRLRCLRPSLDWSEQEIV